MKRLLLITQIIISVNFAYAFFEPTSFDRSTLRDISGLKKYCGVKEIFDGLSFIGSTNMIGGYFLVMSSFGDSTMKKASKIGTISLIIAQAITLSLKTAIDRERPTGKAEKPWKSSFPSGHTSSSFAAAYTVGVYYPKLRIPLFVIATGVGVSRVGLEAHWITDVFAGACVGIVSGVVSSKLSDKILKLQLR